ncbi:hypothetical protein VTN77DRAFT_7665 [Rasamsonia byssochlamydoides]|uniref:uncharacterized protein n=1 Tax=Rasamsonia byssochlamydoides TaxID=89139 RepID=UPI003742CC54
MTLTIMERKLFLAPIGDSSQRVLDIATGTGIWAIDFADEYPSAEVIGNDLSPTQPSMSISAPPCQTTTNEYLCRVPPNLRFIVDDIESEWAYDTPLDFHPCSLSVLFYQGFQEVVEAML